MPLPPARLRPGFSRRFAEDLFYVKDGEQIEAFLEACARPAWTEALGNRPLASGLLRAREAVGAAQ